ncbi:lipid-binding SYLF domain-containing protein [Jeongeupia chitinilytica]|uniref:Ysc84 actin-binding domain-containing protein n=1 Tax=Jeongeupia chitinilytica TaxID=1041641 RepID=A0ABQ3H556_9NEIS|nr:YSC84-related protein [Jeongeupia chitinilytica]GHD67690.1 hypothetical protein GCM10007350_31740 [Jeongeupia chitinilytica]
MKLKWLFPVALVGALVAQPVLAEAVSDQAKPEADAKSPAAQRAKIRELANDTLAQIYKAHPEAEATIAKSAGYAVFDTGGAMILFAGAGGGSGVAVSLPSKHETFMGVAQAKAGLGLGIKNSRLVLVFTSPKAFNKFVTSGWAFSGDATAAAKANDKGLGLTGASMIAKDVFAYQFTENGLTAEATVAGSKYYVDKKLNAGK